MQTTVPKMFKCYLVDKPADGPVTAGVTERRIDELPEGDVLVRVAYSSLNYKDALAATGHRGIVKRFPHVPGVDAAGTVVHSDSPQCKVGDEVLVTGFDNGATRWGGWAEYLRVPHDWIVPRPEGLSLREAMILGTAGLTAAMCVDALQKHDVPTGQRSSTRHRLVWRGRQRGRGDSGQAGLRGSGCDRKVVEP